MKLEILETRVFPEAYRTLADSLEETSIFFSSFWFDNLIAHVIQPAENVLWFGIKSASNAPLLLLPLVQTKGQIFRGTKLSGLANYYTTLYEPLQAFNDQEQLTIATERVITAVCQLKCDVIDLYPLNPASACYPLLIHAFKKNKRDVTPYFMYGNWYLLTQGQSFAEYWAARPSRLKNTIKRKTNKLKTKKIEYRIAQRPDEVTVAVSLYQQTYHASWKRDEPYPEFIPGFVKIAAEQGWLRLGLLFIDYQIAAAQIWLSVAHTAYIYKLCQNPDFDEYSPGSQLTVHLMRHVMDVDKVSKVDFLSGDDLYKKDWMSHRQELWGLQIVNSKTIYGFALTINNHMGLIKKTLLKLIK